MNIPYIKSTIQDALREDVAYGDFTSLACISPHAKGSAILHVKDTGVLAGLELAKIVFHEVDVFIEFKQYMQDGDIMKHGDKAFEVYGNMRSILKAERLVLNFMQRMSGIASQTAMYVDKVKHTSCVLLDTRKTTPLVRYFEKWAVRIGGAQNHRFGLFDMIMIKDNHVDCAGSIAIAIQKANQYLAENKLELAIEIETRSLAEVDQVLEIGNVNRIMLDNFSVEMCKEAVALINNRFETEASGGIMIDNVADYTATGVNYISIGAFTHQIHSKDLSLKVLLT